MRLALSATCALLASLVTGCFVQVPLEGRLCNADHACAEGWRCEDGTCVRGAAPPTDAGTDAGFDAGIDADAGGDAGPPPLFEDAPFGPGLIGYWSFNDLPQDESFTDFASGALTGQQATFDAGTRPARIPGVFAAALRFDGVDDEVLVPDTVGLDFAVDEPFSFEAWVRTSDDCLDERPFVSRFTLGVAWLLTCFDQDAGARAGFGFRDSNGIAALGYSDVEINDGEWHHLVGVRNLSELVLYLDADRAVEITTSFTGDFDATAPLTFAHNGINGRHIAADLDEVRLWRRALSDSDVARLYRTFRPDLIGFWAFEEKLTNLGGGSYTPTGVSVGFAPGAQGYALSLDGAGSFARFNELPRTIFEDDFTVSLWVASTGAGGTGAGGTVASLAGGAVVTFNAVVYATEVKASIVDAVGTELAVVVPASITDGALHHLAVRRAGADSGDVTLTLFVDGVSSGEVLQALGDTTTVSADLELGRGAGGAWRGLLDELQIYSRALSDDEITGLTLAATQTP